MKKRVTVILITILFAMSAFPAGAAGNAEMEALFSTDSASGVLKHGQEVTLNMTVKNAEKEASNGLSSVKITIRYGSDFFEYVSSQYQKVISSQPGTVIVEIPIILVSEYNKITPVVKFRVKPNAKEKIATVIDTNVTGINNGKGAASQKISSNTVILTVSDETPTAPSKIVTAKPTEKVTKTFDSSLRNVSFSEGTLFPNFQKDILRYTLKLPYETEKLLIRSEPSDKSAGVNAPGEIRLRKGQKLVFSITVTSPDGVDQRTYLFNILRTTAVSQAAQKQNKNKIVKAILWTVAAIAVLAAAYFIYRYIRKKREEARIEDMYK